MIYKVVCTIVLVTTLLVASEGLYGVVSGGTIHQFAPAPYADAQWIYFANGIRVNVDVGEPELPQSLTRDRSDYYLIHCRGPVYPEHVEAIKAAGGTVYSYVANYAFVVRMDGNSVVLVENLPFVDWIGIYQPAYKVSSQEEFEELHGVHKITVIMYPDADCDKVIAYLEGIGATINDVAKTEWDQLINCEVDLEHLHEIARVDEVNWVEPWYKMELHNNNVQWIVQTGSSGNRRVWDMGITGDGELISTCDSGIRTSHYAFRNTSTTWISTWGDYPSHRKIIAYEPANSYGAGYADFGDESGLYYHGTHTAGTACGDDDVMGSPSTYDGVAIDSRIFFLDGGGSQGGIYLYPNLNTLFNEPYTGNAAGSVKCMSNSWGSPVGGQYTASSAQVDQFMWDHPDFLIFFSTGNNGPGSGTVGAPSSAKNCVSVGGCRNGSNYQQIYTSSSRGPTQDGRYKPTIIAPGQTVNSAYGGNDNSYWGMEGTSMATPAANGAGVLVREYFRDGWYPTGAANPSDSMSPSAALVKAVLVISADPSVSGYTNVPNNNIGWGRIDLDSSLYFAGDTKKLSVIDEQTGLSTGQYVEYTYSVSSSGEAFRVALVWTDYPATAGAGIKLINDLNLTVTDPSANQYRGNVYSGGQSTTGGSYDSLNVEECVRINTPATGTWTVRVDALNCPQGPQPFAIVVTGDISGTQVEEHRYDEVVTPGITVYPVVARILPYTVSYALEKETDLRVSVYDVTGGVVTTKDYGTVKGTGEVVLNLNEASQGVYFINITAGGKSTTHKIIKLK
jgi:hypothetical protein